VVELLQLTEGTIQEPLASVTPEPVTANPLQLVLQTVPVGQLLMPSLCEKTTAWAVANAGNREESAKIASEGSNKRTVFSMNPRNALETAYSSLANDREQLRLDALVWCCAARALRILLRLLSRASPASRMSGRACQTGLRRKPSQRGQSLYLENSYLKSVLNGLENNLARASTRYSSMLVAHSSPSS